MSRRLGGALLCVLGASLGLAPCAAQSQTQTSTVVPAYPTGPFARIGIVAVLANQSEDQKFETAAAAQFAAAGVAAVPGTSFLGPDPVRSKAEMENAVRQSGADAVLIYRVLAIDSTRSYVRPGGYAVADSAHADWWGDRMWGYYAPYPYHYWGYWYPAFQVVTQPAYWEGSAGCRVQAALYRATDDRLVWSATSGTYDSANAADLGAASLVAADVKELQHTGLVSGAASR